MTTEAAARLYEAQHVAKYDGRPLAVHNPHEKPLSELPVIYGFNNGGRRDWWDACLLAQDGTCLGGHVCSSESYMPYDLGCLEGTRPDRHETFRKHYPDGYRMEFLTHSQCRTHEAFQSACSLSRQKTDAEQANAQ